MRGLSALLLIVTLPLLAAIGHDLYLFYENQFQGAPVPPAGWMGYLSALGFIWTRYSPESYTWVAESTPTNVWAVLNALLTIKAVFVTAAFAAIFYIAVAVIALLKRFTTIGDTGFRKGSALSSIARDKKMSFHYKKR